MKKKSLDPILLSEEIKRFKILNEYSFYAGNENDDLEKPLLLGTDLEEADEEGQMDNQDIEADVNDIGDELGVSDETPPNVNEPVDDMSGEEGFDDEEIDFSGDDIPEEEPIEEPIEEPVEDEVEIDVTSIVKGSEEAKAAAEQAEQAANRTAQELMQKLSDLEVRLSKMDDVTAKIDGLEKEIIKRNPTPVEKLEMRSLSSYPYSQKLTDYWSEKEGPYDVMNQEKQKEYVLTKNDVDSNYSDSQIKNSFDAKSNDYEEEDI